MKPKSYHATPEHIAQCQAEQHMRLYKPMTDIHDTSWVHDLQYMLYTWHLKHYKYATIAEIHPDMATTTTHPHYARILRMAKRFYQWQTRKKPTTH